jgi:hypothetical protein
MSYDIVDMDMDMVVDFLRGAGEEVMAEAVANLEYDFRAALRVNQRLEKLIAEGPSDA